MSGINEVVYWDTCIFLADIKGEKHGPLELEGIREQIARLERDELIIVTSSLTIVEVLDCKLSPQQKLRFPELRRNKNLQMQDPDVKIMELAGEIRNFYQIEKQRSGAKSLAVPDAIHVATAIHMKCPVLYSFDTGEKSEHRGILSLTGLIAGKHKLVVDRPKLQQDQINMDGIIQGGNLA